LRYDVVSEQGDTSWRAYVPDLPGCAAVGAAQAEALTVEAIGAWLEGGARTRGSPYHRLAVPPGWSMSWLSDESRVAPPCPGEPRRGVAPSADP
jgi:predicted RNase H-like HicB family nuclease